MVRRTWGQAKAQFSRVAGSTGMSTSDARLMEYYNQAVEELMNEFDFPFLIDRLVFNVTDGRITLPSNYDRIMMMTLNHVPIQMQSPWYQFIGYGMDLLCDFDEDTYDEDGFGLWGLQGALDRDDVGAFRDAPIDTTYVLRVYGQVDETVDGERPDIIIQGYDANNKWIRSKNSDDEWIDGITIAINGDTAPFYIQSTQTIKEIVSIQKPVTNGNAYVYAAQQDASGTPFHMGTYAPKDTAPFYRRYRINNLNCERTYHILARCRRRFVPVTQDGDFLLISNIPAMKAMIQAVYYMEANKVDDYANAKAIAINILKKEATAYIGLQRMKPVITFGEQMGVGNRGNYIL